MAIHYDMSWQEYIELPAMNQSTIKAGLKSMLQLRHDIDNPRELTQANVRLGSGAQSLLELGPDGFDRAYAVMPNLHMLEANVDAKGKRSTSKNTKAYRDLREAWEAEHASRTIVTESEFYAIRGMVSAVHDDPEAGPLVRSARHEVTLTWEMYGIECKARLDLLGDGWYGDNKTTGNIEQRAFGRTFFNFRYDFQLAWYRQGLRHNGIRDYECKLITIEQAPPHDVAVVPVSSIVLDNVEGKIERVCRNYKDCLVSGHWPGVANGNVYELYLPNWAMADDGDGLDWGDVA